MVARAIGGDDGEVSLCPEGHGIFLARADLGSLIEAETDWHRNAGQHTGRRDCRRERDTAFAPSTTRAARRAARTRTDRERDCAA